MCQFRLHDAQDAAGSDAHLIRVMPNTPCLVGESASAMCLGGKANEKDSDDVHTLFAAVGKIFKVGARTIPVDWQGWLTTDNILFCMTRQFFYHGRAHIALLQDCSGPVCGQKPRKPCVSAL